MRLSRRCAATRRLPERPHARRGARAAVALTPSTDALTPTPGNLACSSIAGRRASGFLQVSLSKVSRHPDRGSSSYSRRDTSDNANDLRIIWPNPCGRGSRQTRAAPRPAGYRSASRRATRPESSDPGTSSREDERETGATEFLPGTHFPQRSREPTRRSAGPDIHLVHDFPAILAPHGIIAAAGHRLPKPGPGYSCTYVPSPLYSPPGPLPAETVYTIHRPSGEKRACEITSPVCTRGLGSFCTSSNATETPPYPWRFD